MHAGPSLRAALKLHTAAAHDRLDAAMGALDLARRGDYVQFLRLQLAARAPIERWAHARCEEPLRPPPTVPLLLADLRELGAEADLEESLFAPPVDAHPLGLAWAIGGSHFGNRALLARLSRQGAPLPSAFLEHPAMAAFWRTLKPRLEVPADEALLHAARATAEAVFECFARQIPPECRRVAA